MFLEITKAEGKPVVELTLQTSIVFVIREHPSAEDSYIASNDEGNDVAGYAWAGNVLSRECSAENGAGVLNRAVVEEVACHLGPRQSVVRSQWS